MKIKQFMFIQKKRRERGEKKRPESGSSPSFEKLTGLFISFEDMRSNLRKVKGHNVMKMFYPHTRYEPPKIQLLA